MDFNEIKAAIADNIENATTAEMRRETVAFINQEIIPFVSSCLDAYKQKCSAAAANESGWCKFRDATFLPFLASMALKIASTVVGKMVAADPAPTSAEEAAAPQYNV